MTNQISPKRERSEILIAIIYRLLKSAVAMMEKELGCGKGERE